jgi:hypothetical protein
MSRNLPKKPCGLTTEWQFIVYAYDEARAANPGDISIREYKIIGPAPDTHHYAVLDGLKLLAEPDFGPGREPGFFVEVRNAGVDTRTIMSYVLGPLLLGPSPVPPFGPPERDVSSAIGMGLSWILGDGKVGMEYREPALQRTQLIQRAVHLNSSNSPLANP